LSHHPTGGGRAAGGECRSTMAERPERPVRPERPERTPRPGPYPRSVPTPPTPAGAPDRASTIFPMVEARDLEGRDVVLPTAFEGKRNVVIVAFRRKHQGLVDSWVPWLEARAADDPDLRFYELPTIGRIWAPVRPFIDGGMASAIVVPAVLRRTFTVYGDVRRLTGPLDITDQSTISLFLVDGSGAVRWSGTGGFDDGSAVALGKALDSLR